MKNVSKTGGKIMRKTQQKIIDRAVKHGFSEKKIEFLSKECYPVKFYDDIFYILNIFSDEELGDFSVFERLYDILGSSIKYYDFTNLSMKDILEVLELDAEDSFKANLFAIYTRNKISFSHAIEFATIYNSHDYEDLSHTYRYLRCKNVESNWELFLEYCKIDYVNTEFLDYALQNNISVKEAEQYNFEINNFPGTRYQDRFPWLAKQFELNEYGKNHSDLIQNVDKVRQICSLSSDLDITGILNIHSETINIRYSNMTLNIDLYSFPSISWNTRNEIYPVGKSKEEHLLCFPDGSWYRKNDYMKKWTPLGYRMLVNIAKTYPLFTRMVMDQLIDHLHEQNLFAMKDLICFIKDDRLGSSISPVTVNEALKCKDLNELFRNHYVDGNLYNWNKKNISTGYIFTKAIKKISKKDLGILIDFCNKHHDDTEVLNCYDFQELLQKILQERCNIPDDSEDECMISDYIDMAIQLHEKINLNFKSIKKITEAHDDLYARYRNKCVGKVEIPKDSKFNLLEKKLPDYFKRIKSSKAIKAEGLMILPRTTLSGGVSKTKCKAFFTLGDEHTPLRPY